VFESIPGSGQAHVTERTSHERAPQLQSGRFANPEPPHDDLLSAARRWLKGAPNREPSSPIETIRMPSSAFNAAPDELHATWLGHSTVLLELAGIRILTDPVWVERASPLPHIGPRRFFPPPIPLAELPPVHVVVISHDHYDHLDRRAVTTLAGRGSRLVAPLGVGRRLVGWGIPARQVTELGWWDEVTVDGVRLVCTPARHFSGRGLLDRNRTLWSGWALLGPHARIFFSGDSGMSTHFEQIGRRLGPFDLTLMEVGAYDQSWPDVHMGPENAVVAHHLVGGRALLPIHWATFNLALHAWTDPGTRVLAEAERRRTRVVTPRPGERLDLANPSRCQRWWPAAEGRASGRAASP
jgi:L-ascorbate metabolism protein UlaG (beta-lactamase superfamily)